MTAVRTRAARWAAVLLALVATAATAACAGPPSKGEVHGALLNQSRNNVVILAREPTPDMPPELLVNNFLQALTGDQKDPTFSVAQEYLASDIRAKWIPPGSTLVTTTKIVDYRGVVAENDQPAVDHGHPVQTPSSASDADTGPWTVGEVKTVDVSGPEVAQVDENGFFQYVQSQQVKQSFTVKYYGPGTGWRIAAVPEFRMVTPEAFKRAYQAYQSPFPVYLPLRGSVSDHMDQVYLTQANGKIADTYTSLAEAVLRGRYPSQDTRLHLHNPVTVDSAGLATVTLQVPPGGMPNIADVRHAMLLTFRDAAATPQLLAPTQLAYVQVTYAGCGAQCEQMSVMPEAAPSQSVYWVCPQGSNDSAIVSRQVGGPPGTQPVCPTNGTKASSAFHLDGVHLVKNSPIAVKQSADPGDVKATAAATTVAVVEENGDVVVLNDKNSDQHAWYHATNASKVSDLEWDPVDGSLWVVDADSLYRVQDPGPDGPSSASQQSVSVPGQQLIRFKLSPDGLRAVVVSPQTTTNPGAASSPQPASMVTVDRTGGQATLSTDTVFPLLAGPTQTTDNNSTALGSVKDAAWADGRTVVLLGATSDSTTPKLYKVYLDGSQDSTILDPDDAQPGAEHLAAAIGPANGHTSMWAISDAPGPNGQITYFKRTGGSDSFQELGSSPAVATLVAG